MKILKNLLFGLLAVLALFALVSFMLPSPAPVERSTTIDSSADVIFQQVNNLRNWENWSAWAAKDPSMKVVYGDKVEGEGSSYSWDGEIVGKGNLAIVKSDPGKSLNTELDFGFMGRGEGLWTFDESDGKTKVTWAMKSLPGKGVLANIIGRYFLVFEDLDPLVGPDFEEGLAGIKKICENSNGSKFEKVEVLGTTYYTIRDEVKMTDIKQFFSENYPKVMQQISQDQLEMTGVPRGIYYSWDEENQISDMAAAIPVSPIQEQGKGNKKINIGPGEADVYDNYIVYSYFGDYSDMVSAHEGLGKACESVFKKPPAVVMEEYVTDPSTEPDNSKWLTRIYYVIK
jgi:Polyketide cyclase / dehydrase and lipid transport